MPKNPFVAGALPRTPLGELTTPPDPLVGWGREIPSPDLSPLVTCGASTSRLRRLPLGSSIFAHPCKKSWRRLWTYPDEFQENIVISWQVLFSDVLPNLWQCVWVEAKQCFTTATSLSYNSCCYCYVSRQPRTREKYPTLARRSV